MRISLTILMLSCALFATAQQTVINPAQLIQQGVIDAGTLQGQPGSYYLDQANHTNRAFNEFNGDLYRASGDVFLSGDISANALRLPDNKPIYMGAGSNVVQYNGLDGVLLVGKNINSARPVHRYSNGDVRVLTSATGTVIVAFDEDDFVNVTTDLRLAYAPNQDFLITESNGKIVGVDRATIPLSSFLDDLPTAGLYQGSGSLPAGQTTAGITDTLLFDGANIDYLLAPSQHVWQFLDGFGFNHTVSLDQAGNKIEIKNEKGPISSSIASGNGVITVQGVMQLDDGRLDLTGSLNTPAIGTDQASWNPTGFQDFTVVNMNATSALNIHSMPAGSDGQVKIITNTGNATATFVFNSSTGTSQKFTMLPDYTSYELVRGATAFFMYSTTPTVNGWKLIN